MNKKEITDAEIKALFPIETYITQDIIDMSIRGDRENCIGANALRLCLPKELHDQIDWGTGYGRVRGIPIRSMTNKIIEGEITETQYYPQHATTPFENMPIYIKFIFDKKRNK